MSCISIFCPNSINILAGINGIEVAQSIVIALLVLLNDLLYLPFTAWFLPNPLATDALSTPSTGTPWSHPATDSHLFSIYLLLPFLGVSLALLSQNWYPARVFVGDTYCYFAGMVFAIVAILAHFSKTLLLLLIPQILNFLYSAPQLFNILPCPRHRLPHFNARTGLLEASWVDWSGEVDGALVSKMNGHASSRHVHNQSSSHVSPNGLQSGVHRERSRSNSVGSRGTSPVTGGLTKFRRIKTRATPLNPIINSGLRLLAALRLVETGEDDRGNVIRCTNLTILNLWLVWFGPMREDKLALGLLSMQLIVGLIGLWVRHRMALWVFPVDNLIV